MISPSSLGWTWRETNRGKQQLLSRITINEMEQSFSTLALPWTQSRPLALPKQLGDGIDIELLKQKLQRLIVRRDVGAVVMFGSRAQGTAGANSDLIWR